MKIWSSHLLDDLSNCLMNLKNSYLHLISNTALHITFLSYLHTVNHLTERGNLSYLLLSWHTVIIRISTKLTRNVNLKTIFFWQENILELFFAMFYASVNVGAVLCMWFVPMIRSECCYWNVFSSWHVLNWQKGAPARARSNESRRWLLPRLARLLLTSANDVSFVWSFSIYVSI